MNGNWLETVQSLGLDIMLGAIVALLVLDAFEPVVQRWRASMHARAMPAVEKGSTGQVPEATDIDATEAEAVTTGRRTPRPEWLAGRLKGLPTRNDMASPATPADERSTLGGKRAA